MTAGEDQFALAHQLLARREVVQARVAFDAAERGGVPADACSAGRWTAAMLLGDFESAWRESDAIRRRGAPDPHRFWQGEALEGRRVMLRCLHGFGDAVQMLRFAPALAARASELIVEVPPRMLELAPCFRGVNHVITWGEQAPVQSPEWDVQVEVMELPYLLRVSLDELPGATYYLLPRGDVIGRVAQAMGVAQKPRVGVVWRSGEWDESRSIPFAALRPLLEIEDVQFWNLQGGIGAADARDSEIQDAKEICGDGLVALASTILNLDLVITVDTLAAHLAGALGKPAWVMLQHAADWRWMVDRDDSPWYPTMRLFRQPVAGDWKGLVSAVQEALATQWVTAGETQAR